MKAWLVTEYIDYGSTGVVFAQDVNDAKKKYKESHKDCKYIDLRVKRVKMADDKESLTKEEFILFLLGKDWYHKGYPIIEDDIQIGTVNLFPTDIQGINDMGFNNYVRAKLFFNNLKMDEFDTAILRRLHEQYEWLARNKDGNLVLFKEKPSRDLKNNTWLVPNDPGCLLVLNETFLGITWETIEPVNITESIKLMSYRNNPKY